MKKIILLFVAALITVSLSAQEFGGRLGVDFASAKLDLMGESDTESGTGFYVGFFASFDISETFAVRPEINYVSVDIEDTPFDQIAIPVLADFSVSDNFHILAGPSFGFMLDTDEGMDSFNFGIDFGLALDFSEKFAIEGRYNLGISNLLEDGDMFDASVKLSGFVLGLAYTFN